MRKGGGKSKGAEFERLICKQLSLAMTDGNRDDLFWRSAMSGGRATVKAKKGIKNLTQVGDITAIDLIGSKLTDKYVIECKNYKSVHLESLFYGKPKSGSVLGFWRQACKSDLLKLPLLIFKESGKSIMVMKELESWESEWKRVFSIENCRIQVFLFEDFLTCIDDYIG